MILTLLTTKYESDSSSSWQKSINRQDTMLQVARYKCKGRFKWDYKP